MERLFRAVDRPRYDEELNRQIGVAKEKAKIRDLDELFRSGDTWTVER